MANDDMRNEIEELRAQVAALTAERKAKEKEQAQAGSNQEPSKESATQDSGTTESTEDQATNLTSQFQELVDTIGEELKEASPVTVLVVFVLGVLVGRLLPR